MTDKYEEMAQEKRAFEIVHIVLKNFEACGIILKDVHPTQRGMAIADAAQALETPLKQAADEARAEEREVCAKVAEGHRVTVRAGDGPETTLFQVGDHIAAAMRARSGP